MSEGPKTCSLCGRDFVGWGNNPEPLLPYEGNTACDMCNAWQVLPARLKAISKSRHPTAHKPRDRADPTNLMSTDRAQQPDTDQGDQS